MKRAEDVTASLVEVVDRRRKARKIPRCRFASLCGMHRNTYARLRQPGSAGASVEFLILASYALCVTPEQLLKEAQEAAR